MFNASRSNVQCFAFKCSMLRVQCSMLCVKGLILRALSLSKCNTFVVQGSNAFVVQGSNAFGVQGSNARMFKCSNVRLLGCSNVLLFKGSRFNWLGTELVEEQCFAFILRQAQYPGSSRSIVQMFGFSIVRMFYCSNVQLFKCLIVESPSEKSFFATKAQSL